MLEIYTDGATTLKQNNGVYERGFGGAAEVVICNGLVSVSYQPLKETTNNEAELFAILRGLLEAYDLSYNGKFDRNKDEFLLYSDSAYSINCITQWAATWEKNGWTRGAKHEPIKNLELIKAIYGFKDLFPTLNFIKVRGHSDNKGNIMADEYAVKGKMEASKGKKTVSVEKWVGEVNKILKSKNKIIKF